MTATLPRRAFLGAELPGDTEAFTADGVWVAGSVPGGMAERAGIAAGDRLIALAGIEVRTLADLGVALRRAGGQPSATIVYARGDERHACEVETVSSPCEPGADYGAHAGLRTIAVTPPAPRALVLYVAGIACETIDLATQPDAPLAGLIAGWARAGIASLRFDKRGVGDSGGAPGHTIDFATELADARAMLALAVARATELAVPLFVFGHSVGGIIAAHLAHDRALAGVIVYGTPVMRWFDCLADSIRRQKQLHGASQAELDAIVGELDVLARDGELNGRSAAYHRQLHAIDLEAAWRRVAVRTLVLRGEHDWVVRAEDQARIAALASADTAIVDLPGLDHLFGRHGDRDASLRDYGVGAFDPAIVEATVAWIALASTR